MNAAQAAQAAQATLAPPLAWSSNLGHTPTARTGAVTEADMWVTAGTILSVAGTGLGAYHGYKRNRSVGWAIVWALLGGAFPIVTIPVALAQGFAKRGK